MKQKYDLSILATNWEAPVVAREEIGIFSGGILNPRTMANCDANGTGPKGKFRVGRKVAYDVKFLVEWMKNRQNINTKQQGGLSK